MTMNKKFLLLSASLAFLSAAGCGGGGDNAQDDGAYSSSSTSATEDNMAASDQMADNSGEMMDDSMAGQDDAMMQGDAMDESGGMMEGDAMAGGQSATATLRGADNSSKGTVSLSQRPNGVSIVATLSGLPAGVHGFHIHKTGKCDGDFSSAGGHFAPEGHDHGRFDAEDSHAGDMKNIEVGDNGTAQVRITNAKVSLVEGEPGYLFDQDGSAIVIHSGPDDYQSQPSGDAGSRIACGVINKAG